MNLKRRMATVVTVIGLLPVVGACGASEGGDVDCAAIADDLVGLSDNMGEDDEKFALDIVAFRETADEMDDPALKLAMHDYADQAEKVHDELSRAVEESDPDIADPNNAVLMDELGEEVGRTCEYA